MKLFNNKQILLITLAIIIVSAMLGVFATTVSAAPFSVSINFQNVAGVTPPGYLADSGGAYGARNGQTYGWFTEASLNGVHVPIDATAEGRDRNNYFADQRFDTLMHMQRVALPTDVLPNVAWEIAVPNGLYRVEVGSGDQPGAGGVYDSVHRINVEGTMAYNFQATAAIQTIFATVDVTVADGNLTIDAVGGTNSKINYIIINDIPDADADLIPDATDNCPAVANPTQANNYPAPAGSDAQGDACDDSDADTVLDIVDACPTTFGTLPDGCNPPTPTDSDGDGFADNIDACPAVAGGAPSGCPAPVGGNGGTGVYFSPDDRINWGAPGGNDVAIYLALRDASNPAIHVYCINNNSQGYFGLAVSLSDLAQFPARPASNLLVATSNTCGLSFYILTSGDFQLNIGPLDNNEVVEVVFDGLPPENVTYNSYIDNSGGANVGGTPTTASASNGAVVQLSNCRVTPLNILNFRATASASSEVLTMIPFNYTVEAIARTADRFNVIFGDQNGWITADPTFVETDGNCGD